MLGNLINALYILLEIEVMLAIFGGVFAGLVIGAIPVGRARSVYGISA